MASTYLYRTTGTATSTQKFTVSAWVKQCLNPTGATDQTIWGNGSSTTNLTYLRLRSANNSLQFYLEAGGTEISNYVTNRLFRDTNAWYHIVLAVDTTQSTAANRVKIYVNGVQETSFSSSVVPSVNHSVAYLSSNLVNIGRRPHANDSYFDGYMNNVVFVDGTQLAPSSFGETDSTSGIWKFKSPSGVTFGNNGFHLKMDNSANLGLDSSGETNNFTLSGNGRQAKDTPTNVRATMNPLDNYWQGFTFSNGNNTVTTTNASQCYSTSSLMASSGKWYVECKPVSGGSEPEIGIFSKLTGANAGSSSQLSYNANGYAYRASNPGSVWYNGSAVSTGFSQYANGDIIGIALDLDNNKLYFRKNGEAWGNSGNPTSGATGTGAISIVDPASTTLGAYGFGMNETFNDQNKVFSWNFGNGYFGTTAISSAGSNGNGSLFEYDVPSGYYALNTKNINTYG